jgi:hypothetical protein
LDGTKEEKSAEAQSIFYFQYKIGRMDQIKQIQAFVNSATRGSLSAAAQLAAVTPAVIGRRLDALETRLGVKLLLRVAELTNA